MTPACTCIHDIPLTVPCGHCAKDRRIEALTAELTDHKHANAVGAAQLASCESRLHEVAVGYATTEVRIKALEAREAAARAILEPLAECDPAIRAWLRVSPFDKEMLKTRLVRVIYDGLCHSTDPDRSPYISPLESNDATIIDGAFMLTELAEYILTHFPSETLVVQTVGHSGNVEYTKAAHATKTESYQVVETKGESVQGQRFTGWIRGPCEGCGKPGNEHIGLDNYCPPRTETAAEPIDQAPIARVIVTEDAPAGVVLYAPGLPPGEFDVYLEPTSDRQAKIEVKA